MTEVAMSIRGPNGWLPVGKVGEPEPCGSISDHGVFRSVYVFGFRDGEPGVWRTDVAVAVENSAVRGIAAIDDLARLSDLSEPYEVEITSKTGLAVNLRFELVEDS